jgi:hypothetical protein
MACNSKPPAVVAAAVDDTDANVGSNNSVKTATVVQRTVCDTMRLRSNIVPTGTPENSI